MESCQGCLPDEIVFQILSFCRPLDVVSARSVSKQFRSVTCDPKLWRDLYESAPLPRPPGPYPFQSTEFLERTLVQSERTAQTWTTEPFQVISCRDIRVADPLPFPFRVVCGRWLLVRRNREIVLYDLQNTDRAHYRQVIWKQPQGNDTSSSPEPNQQKKTFRKTIGSFFKKTVDVIENLVICPVTSPEGEFFYVINRNKELVGGEWHWKVQLLEFLANGDSGQPVFCNLWRISNDSGPIPYPLNLFNNGSTLLRCKAGLFFDTKTRVFCQIPEFWSELLTRTHILVTTPFSSSHRILLAFALPADPRPLPNRTCVLSLTHECLVPRDYILIYSLIRNSIVDPLTGSTSIRYLPFYIDSHHIFTVDTPFSSPVAWAWVQASDDGYVRGFCQIGSEEIWDRGEALKNHEVYSVKFAIDASKDKCIPSVGKLERMDPRWHFLKYGPCTMWFDGARGKLGYGGCRIMEGKPGQYHAPCVLDIK